MISLTCETCPVDILHPVVGDKELFLPPHEDRSSVQGVLHRQMRLIQLILDMSERGEPSPVHHVLLLGRSPIARQEAIATSNDLRVKVRRELWPVVRQAADPEVATQVGRCKVDVLEKKAIVCPFCECPR